MSIWNKKSKIEWLKQFIEDFSLFIKQFYRFVLSVKNTESKNPKAVKNENGTIMLLSKCTVCDSKKLRFIKEQDASGLLSSLGIKKSLSKIPLVGPLLF